MQSLWGCAYEMRSLGDVNYKITLIFYADGYKKCNVIITGVFLKFGVEDSIVNAPPEQL
jgi:hypothetical protein